MIKRAYGTICTDVVCGPTGEGQEARSNPSRNMQVKFSGAAVLLLCVIAVPHASAQQVDIVPVTDSVRQAMLGDGRTLRFVPGQVIVKYRLRTAAPENLTCIFHAACVPLRERRLRNPRVYKLNQLHREPFG